MLMLGFCALTITPGDGGQRPSSGDEPNGQLRLSSFVTFVTFRSKSGSVIGFCSKSACAGKHNSWPASADEGGLEPRQSRTFQHTQEARSLRLKDQRKATIVEHKAAKLTKNARPVNDSGVLSRNLGGNSVWCPRNPGTSAGIRDGVPGTSAGIRYGVPGTPANGTTTQIPRKQRRDGHGTYSLVGFRNARRETVRRGAATGKPERAAGP